MTAVRYSAKSLQQYATMHSIELPIIFIVTLIVCDWGSNRCLCGFDGRHFWRDFVRAMLVKQRVVFDKIKYF